ncbi:hypothetical protein ECV0102_15780 [Enterobacter cloacae]|nr:hypothetical protein ECV0102_15780 [Enterobacter cloacae]
MRVKQVKTLKGGLGIVSDEGICRRPNDGREMDSGGRFNNIDNQTVFFQFITMLVT